MLGFDVLVLSLPHFCTVSLWITWNNFSCHFKGKRARDGKVLRKWRYAGYFWSLFINRKTSFRSALSATFSPCVVLFSVPQRCGFLCLFIDGSADGQWWIAWALVSRCLICAGLPLKKLARRAVSHPNLLMKRRLVLG